MDKPIDAGTILCRFCVMYGNESPAVATKLMPQDEEVEDRYHINKKRYVLHWLPACEVHAANWFSGDGDTRPPYFEMAQGK